MTRPKNPWPIDQFFSRYADKMMPEPNSGCLLWLGAISGAGYGHINRLGEYIDVHRCAYAAVHGVWPPVVRHTCDTKLCVNDAHLLAGTAQDNSDDAVARNMVAWGERNGRAKLAATQIQEIRKYTGRLSQRKLAAKYGIAQCAISEIRSGKRWRRA